MNLTQIFKRALEELHATECKFAVAGGFAADLYRQQVRGTGDIDFLFSVEGDCVETGKALLGRLGLAAAEIKLHQLTRLPRMNKGAEAAYLLVGRNEEAANLGVDLLLPAFPWFENALERAQLHCVDFGVDFVAQSGGRATPTLTVEDLILSKLFAGRPKDLDDIISIFEAQFALDLSYLAGEMERLELVLPAATVPSAPIALRTLSKRRKGRKRTFPCN